MYVVIHCIIIKQPREKNVFTDCLRFPQNFSIYLLKTIYISGPIQLQAMLFKDQPYIFLEGGNHIIFTSVLPSSPL